MLHIAYIGLGSNLNNPLLQVKSAISELHASESIIVEAVSNIYKSKPIEIKDAEAVVEQADFINAVARIKTNNSPRELLDELQALELKHNRVKEYHWGPRSLDLDILLFDDLIIKTKLLTIPHIELVNRDFVLYPLSEINPTLDIPEHGKLQELLENVTKNDLVLVDTYLNKKDSTL